MSYDYLLFRAPSEEPMSGWAPAPPEELGSAEELQRRIAELFPGVGWRSFVTSPGSFAGTWELDDRYAEFSLVPFADGRHRSFTMKRCSREDVERVCRALGLVAVDPAVKLFRPGSGAWRQEG
jgi:hypothetical protein